MGVEYVAGMREPLMGPGGGVGADLELQLVIGALRNKGMRTVS